MYNTYNNICDNWSKFLWDILDYYDLWEREMMELIGYGYTVYGSINADNFDLYVYRSEYISHCRREGREPAPFCKIDF